MRPDQLLPFALAALALVAFGALCVAFRAFRTIERITVVPRLSPRPVAPYSPGRIPSPEYPTLTMDAVPPGARQRHTRDAR